MMNKRPEELVLTTLQGLLDGWLLVESDDDTKLQPNHHDKIIEQCQFLLGKKKTLDPSLIHSIQHILLLCWLEQEEYTQIIDYVDTNNKNKTTTTTIHSDLKLYAQYRMEQYETIITSTTTKTKTNKSLLQQHVLAQSYFHMKMVHPTLKIYQEMMLTNDENNDDSETKMELLNNALATIAAHVTVPYTLHLDEDEEYQKWLDKSEEFLEDHSEGYHDLAFNLGTLQALLMSPTTTTTTTNRNWLEQARDHCDDEDDLAMIEHNIMWAKQFWQTTTMLDETPDYSDIVSNNKKKNDALSLVAKINQSLLLLSDVGGKLSSLLPSHPNPKWNPLQVRMYWYNRAIGQLKLSDQLVECQESCQSLKRCSNSGGGGDGKKNNNKKKDTKATNAVDLWWEARADVLLAHVQDKQGKTVQAIERLEQRLASLQNQHPKQTKNRSSFVVDHAIAHVSLHLFTIQQQQQQQQQNKKPAASDTIDVLKSLPSSIQSMPAVQATLEALGGNDGDNSNKKKKTKSPIEEADIYFAQGNMEQAANLYTTHLLLPKYKVVSGSNSSSLDETQLAQHLRCVQALAMIGRHDESVQLWDSLQQQQVDESIFTSTTRMNGETLEQQALPRSSTTTTNKTMMLGTNNNNHDASQKSSQRRSHDAILRQRARKRQAYLNDLTIKGQYNPDRSTPLPNPERWIPKHARNNNRRRGQRGNNNRSAQGGGSQADAQRLDAAARRAGTVPTSSGPSTANMKVADGSRKIGRRR